MYDWWRKHGTTSVHSKQATHLGNLVKEKILGYPEEYCKDEPDEDFEPNKWSK